MNKNKATASLSNYSSVVFKQIAPVRHKIQGKWYCFSPEISECDIAPKKLQPMNSNIPFNTSYSTMGSGIYTKKQKEAYEKFISSGSNAREVIADIGDAVIENKKTSFNLFSIFNDEAIRDFQSDIAQRIFGIFANMVNIYICQNRNTFSKNKIYCVGLPVNFPCSCLL